MFQEGNDIRDPDPVEIKVLHFCEVEQIRCGMEEKITQVFFLRTGKNQSCIGIQPACGNHGCKGIEICVNVRGDDLIVHFRRYSFLSPPLLFSSRHGQNGNIFYKNSPRNDTEFHGKNSF